ncbi:MAG: hypothetical protein COA68_07700 [Oceanobacter sp.]|jgi:hypothetical protein|nr:MAG: hypothetical protein COA68_07700 [Oceanobacter sp.]
MKSLISAAIAATFITAAPAFAKEMPKGSVDIGGASGLSVGTNIVSADNTDTVKTSTNTLLINSRYYFQKNIALSFGFVRSDIDIEVNDDNLGSTTTLLTPGLSFNKSLNDDVSLNFGAGFLIAHTRQSVNDSAGSAKGKGIQLNVELQKFISERTSLNIGGQLNKYRVKNEVNETTANITDRLFNVGVSFHFGQ